MCQPISSINISNETVILEEILQSIIDFENNPTKSQSDKVFKKYMLYLDKEIDYETSKELFSLILSCFLHFPDQPTAFFQEIISKSRINSNRIIITASIFSHLNEFKDQFLFSQYKNFVTDSITQILPQIRKDKIGKNDFFLVFEKKIHPKFIPNFIVDILLSIKLKEKSFLAFYPYIFRHHKLISQNQMKRFVRKIVKSGLAPFFPGEFLSDECFFNYFSMNTLSLIIPNLSENIFRQILQIIDAKFSEEIWTRQFSISILDKIVNFNIKIKSIYNILNSISPADITNKVWEYLANFDYLLPNQLADKIKKFPNPVAALKVMTVFDNIPLNVFFHGLLKTHDLKVYERIFDSEIYIIRHDIFSKIFSSSKFWNHIVFVASFSKEKYTEKLLLQFAEIFLNFIDKSHVYKIFDSMIFHCARVPNNGIDFICDLLHNLDYNYISEYCKNIELTFQKVIDSKIIPLPSFWGLFNSNYFINLLEKNNSNPIFMYAYLFSNEDENPKPIKSITVVTKLNGNNRNLIKEFIIKKDFDFLANTNEDVLSLIASALIFADCQEKPEVKGLNKETILPFFAIAFNYMADYEGKSLLFESPMMLNQLIMASQFLSRNNSLLLTTSIDSILLKNYFFCNNDFFPTNAAFQILNILIPLLIKNLYRADKNILLSLVFYLSTQNPLENEMKSLFQNHGINLFKFIISNASLMKDYNKVNSFDRLNLNVLSYNQTKQIIIENIQNSSSKETVFNTIYIIENFCYNVPKLDISNFQNIFDLLNGYIIEKQWENCLFICEFLKNQNFISVLQQFSDKPLPFSIKEKLFNDFQIETDDLISTILDDPNPETHYLPFKILFKNLMKDESIGLNYFISLFEKVTKGQTLNLLLFLNIYSDKYNDYKYIIIKALSYSYDYHSQSQTFVRKTEIKKIKQSEIGESIISKLIKEVNKKPDNLQALFCLYNVASSFPFLFDKNPIETFESILPSLNYLQFYFSNERNNENEIKNIKIAIIAFLFLFKSLHSIKVINTFVNWFFKNYKNFTDFHILAFTSIFKSLFISKKVKKALLSLFIKYNLPLVMNELLQKQIQESISLYYQQNIFMLLINYYKYINNLTKQKIIYIDEIRKIENPFDIVFNNFSTISPSDIKEFEIPLLNDDENNQIANFLNDATNNRDFWLSFIKYDGYEDIEPDYDKFDDIVSQYQKLQNSKSNEIYLDPLPFIEFESSTKVIRYLSTKSNWIYQWILNDKTFPLLTEQNNLLINIINEINELAIDDDIDVYDSNININDYFLEEYINEQLFHFLIYNASNTIEHTFDLICNLISSIAENKISFCLLFTQINSFISHYKYDAHSINKLILMLMKIENDEFKSKFVNECGENLIKIALKSDFRNDTNILSDLADLLCSFNNELPLITTHLIGFMFLLNQQHIILKALILCGKFNVNKLNNIIEIIEKAFDRELNKKNPSYYMIRNFLERIPSLGISRKVVLTEMLNKAINMYKYYNEELLGLDEEDGEEKENEELICSIINSFAPERNNDMKLTPSDLNEIDFSLSVSATKINAISKSNFNYLENQIAPKLVKTDPFFWNLYKKHINIIDEIIDLDHTMLSKLNFLIKYPEIMNFKTRSLYFKEKMKKKINNNKILSISIKRSNVLMSSFKQLNKISTDEWMNKISIDFLGEDGIDAGGLTCEWFTLIIKEIFDPKNHLFKSTENESYQPNPSSSQNKNHIELFRFAGKIIARALVQDQYVNAHLTRSFIRQILHRQVKFKDLEDFDKDIYKSMNTILENDVNSFYLNFTINIDNKESIELKENGQNIDLTNENKQEYVSLYTNYHLRKSIIEQINAFSEGFDSLINHEDINIFTPGELDLMICGIPDIDVEDMKKYTEYEYPYHEEHPVVVLFFKVISKWNNDNLAKFLIFLTGSSQVPINGFKDYQDRGKPIIIASGGDRDRLCVAHTCFNTLDLPKYETEEEMNEKLILSIQESEFGIL